MLQIGRIAKGSHSEGSFALVEPTRTHHTAHPQCASPLSITLTYSRRVGTYPVRTITRAVSQRDHILAGRGDRGQCSIGPLVM